MELKEVKRLVVHVYRQQGESIEVPYHVNQDGQFPSGVVYDAVFADLGIKGYRSGDFIKDVSVITFLVAPHSGLGNSSERFFTLTLGTSDKPKRRIKTNDKIQLPISEPIWLRKHVFDLQEEQSLLEDPIATHLLCEEAKRRIEKGDLKPDKEQEAKLDEYSDPRFCMEEAYVKLCQGLPNYFSVVFPNVILTRDFEKAEDKLDTCYLNCCFEDDDDTKWYPPTKLKKESSFDLLISKLGIQLFTGSQCHYVLWKHIISWTYTPEDDSICFSVNCQSGMECNLLMTSPQIHYLVSVVGDVIRSVQIRLKSKPVFLAEMVRKTERSTTWDNALFKSSELTDSFSIGHDLTNG